MACFRDYSQFPLSTPNVHDGSIFPRSPLLGRISMHDEFLAEDYPRVLYIPHQGRVYTNLLSDCCDRLIDASREVSCWPVASGLSIARQRQPSSASMNGRRA